MLAASTRDKLYNIDKDVKYDFINGREKDNGNRIVLLNFFDV